MKEKDQHPQKDKQEEQEEQDAQATQSTLILQEELDGIQDLVDELEIIQNMIGVTTTVEPLRNMTPTTNSDPEFEALITSLSTETHKDLVANNIGLFLSMYLAVDKIEKDRPYITSRNQALAYFEVAANNFRKIFNAYLNPIDDAEDPETGEERAASKQKFTDFVVAADFVALNQLYTDYNVTVTNIAQNLVQQNLGEIETNEFINQHEAQIQRFLNKLEACFPNYETSNERSVPRTMSEEEEAELKFDGDGFPLETTAERQAKVFELNEVVVQIIQEFFKQLAPRIPSPAILPLATGHNSRKRNNQDPEDKPGKKLARPWIQ